MVVLRPARLRAMAHELLVMVEVRVAEEVRRLQRMGTGDRGEEGSSVAEGEVDLEVVEEISEEMGLYLQESGGEAKDCQILDTVVMGEAEEGVGAATDWKLSLPRLRDHLSSQWVDFVLDSMNGREDISTNSYR